MPKKTSSDSKEKPKNPNTRKQDYKKQKKVSGKCTNSKNDNKPNNKADNEKPSTSKTLTKIEIPLQFNWGHSHSSNVDQSLFTSLRHAGTLYSEVLFANVPPSPVKVKNVMPSTNADAEQLIGALKKCTLGPIDEMNKEKLEAKPVSSISVTETYSKITAKSADAGKKKKFHKRKQDSARSVKTHNEANKKATHDLIVETSTSPNNNDLSAVVDEKEDITSKKIDLDLSNELSTSASLFADTDTNSTSASFFANEPSTSASFFANAPSTSASFFPNTDTNSTAASCFADEPSTSASFFADEPSTSASFFPNTDTNSTSASFFENEPSTSASCFPNTDTNSTSASFFENEPSTSASFFENDPSTSASFFPNTDTNSTSASFFVNEPSTSASFFPNTDTNSTSASFFANEPSTSASFFANAPSTSASFFANTESNSTSASFFANEPSTSASFFANTDANKNYKNDSNNNGPSSEEPQPRAREPFNVSIPAWNFTDIDMDMDTFPRFLGQFEDEHYRQQEDLAMLGLRLAMGNRHHHHPHQN